MASKPQPDKARKHKTLITKISCKYFCLVKNIIFIGHLNTLVQDIRIVNLSRICQLSYNLYYTLTLIENQ